MSAVQPGNGTLGSRSNGGRRQATADRDGGDDLHGSERTKTTPRSGAHRALAVVFVALLVDLLSFTMILPLMPSQLEYYSRHDKVCVAVGGREQGKPAGDRCMKS